jgi:proteasome lid subunit RPN8/RPN11
VSDVEIVGGLEIIKPVERSAPIARAQAKGVIKSDHLQIYLPEAVLRQIVDHSASRMEVEVGGLLVGSLCSSKGVPWLDIKGYVPAEHAVHSPASLRFTNDTFAAAWRQKDARFADDIFLGWHHTHPGYGVFLSATDMFTCRNFFNLPWMLALVVDPRETLLQFFQWRGSNMEPCGFYFTA